MVLRGKAGQRWGAIPTWCGIVLHGWWLR